MYYLSILVFHKYIICARSSHYSKWNIIAVRGYYFLRLHYKSKQYLYKSDQNKKFNSPIDSPHYINLRINISNSNVFIVFNEKL
ncbi:unnamed protein product [Moneuplotes crassus]|uniref:Uncharacterized protein n=1 Tax=Euplotes crassus TaxID=5936 RepID=A0AAD1XZ64_EUPCR|nr:unnamed protein product [Moneuplotes crassus]